MFGFVTGLLLYWNTGTTVGPSHAVFGTTPPVGFVSGRNWSQTSSDEKPLPPVQTLLVSLMMSLAERTNFAEQLPLSNDFVAAGVAVIPVPPPASAVPAEASSATAAKTS